MLYAVRCAVVLMLMMMVVVALRMIMIVMDSSRLHAMNDDT